MRLPGLLLLTYLGLCDSGAIQLDSTNIDNIIQNNDLVFINFYADWCRFSNMLSPIWDQTADKVAQQFPDKRVAIGKVDCDSESALGSRYHITKYPTIKYIQHGVLAKKEYRGQRSVESFVSFVGDHVKDPITVLEEITLDPKKRHVVGYFTNREGPEYENFKKLAGSLKEDCEFHVSEREGGNKITFRPAKALDSGDEEEFTGQLMDYEVLSTWAVERCSPRVREITFENAEELTEEGLPFLILFHHPDDTDSVREYNDLVSKVYLMSIYNLKFVNM